MSRTDKHAFGAHFPPNCPPASAVECGGIVYRLVSGKTPTIDDFLTHAELGLAPRADACDRCGLSVYENRGDAIALYQRVVARFGPQGTRIGNLVARLELTAAHGRQLATPNQRTPDSHCTWWPFADVDRVSSFDQIV